MFLTVVATILTCVPAAGPGIVIRGDSLTDLFAGGKTWAEFFEGAKARKDVWRDNYDGGAPDPELVARAQAVGGQWRLLVVAEDWCSDSVNTVPFLARFAEVVSGLELRIVNSAAGRWVMEAHRTADGRAATPTIVLIDESGREVGCFIERPGLLRAWFLEQKPKLDADELQKQKMAWYKEDRGRSTVADMVALMEAAGSGGHC